MKAISRVRFLYPVAILLALFAAIPKLSAKTLYVGTCKPGAYPTIQQAINAAPVGGKVQVCPGQYEEQITITKALTLQGININNDNHVFIDPPSGELVVNAINAFGQKVAAQVLVQNSGGPVNISNIDIFSDFVHGTTYVAGLF